MASAGAAAALPQRVHERWGLLDVLVNNAGLTRDGPFALMPAAQWHEVLGVNLVNTVRLTEAALPLLEKSKGAVVSVSSLAGRAGKEGQVPYSATKAGLVGMTRLIARACRDRNIRAAAVLPGFVNTDMIGALGPKAMEPTLRGSVRPRPGEPEEVAEICAFLAGPGANYLDGAVVPVDGGFRI
jgi:3-oxoacyl-[acyl-carrier protein] reductase